jgi:hypothetical protein
MHINSEVFYAEFMAILHTYYMSNNVSPTLFLIYCSCYLWQDFIVKYTVLPRLFCIVSTVTMQQR